MNRRRVVGWALALVVGSVSAVMGGEKLQSRDLVAICGDSITEQRQYSVFMEDYFLMCQPAAGMRAVQVGWSGERGPGFLARMKQDALVFGPTVATTCYGMNDGGYAAFNEQNAKTYRDSMTAIVKTFKEAGVRFVVMGSPGMVDPNFFPPGYIGKRFADIPAAEYAGVYNQTLDKFREIAKEVAAEQGVAYADVYGAMKEAMGKAKGKYGEKYHVAGSDGIHPAANGHIVMAYAFLKALGCDGNIGTITVDMKGGTAVGTEGHQVLSDKDGVVEVESSRYPFCFFGDPKEPTSTSGIIEFVPFNQELNRFELVVKHAPAKVKVTWGEASKEFTGEQLERGINLAAEFIDNPFCESFKRVEGVIRAQQLYETAVTKTVLNLKPGDVGGREEGFNALKEGVLARDEEMARASATVPAVRYVIKVEAVR